MICFFDTSALVPLLIAEPGSDLARELWDAADQSVAVRLAYPEARAALAAAARARRIDPAQHRAAIARLDDLAHQLTIVELDRDLATRAGQLADRLALRGADAVHLAGAEAVRGSDSVLVAGDARLCDAARALGLLVAPT